MILSFSVFKEKIESGAKHQTIRKFNERQWKVAQNAKKYQLYWHSPRNGGKLIKERERSQPPFLIKFDTCWGIVFFGYHGAAFALNVEEREQLAKDDGFNSYADMVAWFWKEYGEKMYGERFIAYRWLP